MSIFICNLFFTFIIGNGLDMDEYVRKAYKFAYSDCIEVGPVACLPEPPDPNELYPRQSNRQAIVVAWFRLCLSLKIKFFVCLLYILGRSELLVYFDYFLSFSSISPPFPKSGEYGDGRGSWIESQYTSRNDFWLTMEKLKI